MDSLARPVDLESARRRQRVLHGVSLHVAANAGRPVAASRPYLAPLVGAVSGWQSLDRAISVSYEAFALWSSPWVTAWIAIGYFAAAFVVDSFFSGAAFCKYVCPIGPVQLRAGARLAAGSEGSRAGGLRIVRH